MRNCFSIIFVVAILSASAIGFEQEQRFEDITDVVVVEVPVQVIKDGRPVRGLTAENFQITDNRSKREIIGFEQKVPLDEGMEETVNWYLS